MTERGRKGRTDKAALEQAWRVLGAVDEFLGAERVATVGAPTRSSSTVRVTSRSSSSKRCSYEGDVWRTTRAAGGARGAGRGREGGRASRREWSESARAPWSLDPRVEVLPAPVGAEFTAAVGRELERTRTEGGTFDGSARWRLDRHEVPVYGGGGLAPRPARSDFVAYAWSGGRIRTCRHVPARGTEAWKRGSKHVAPAGSGDPQAPELADLFYGQDGDTTVPPAWNAVEAQVARRPFLRYADYLTGAPRGDEPIPLWAL